MSDELIAEGLVALGLFGVLTDHGPLRPCTLVTVAPAAGCDRDFLDAQVPRDGG